MVGASVSWSLGSFFGHRLPLPRDGFVATTWEMLSAGVFLLVLGVATGELGDDGRGRLQLESVAAWLYLAVFGSLIGFTAYAWLLRNAPISKVVTHQYVNPLVAILLGARSSDEQLTLAIGVGAALIVGSVFVAVRQEGASAYAAVHLRALMGEVLQQVGAGEDRRRAPGRRDDDGRARAGEVGEHLVERVADVDRGERRLHRDRDVLVQRVGVLEDAVEHAALLERADDVRERLGRARAGRPAAARSSSAASGRSPRPPSGATRS